MKCLRLVALMVFASSPWLPAMLATEPPITALTFTPDGKAVAAVSQTGLQVFSWPDLHHQRTIQALAANLHCLAFSPDGTLLAVGGGNPAEEGMVEVFSWPAGTSMTTLMQHEDSVMSIRWLDATHVLSAGLDRLIQLYDLEEKSLVRSFRGHSRGVSSLGVLEDEALVVSGGDDQSLRVWNASTGELVRNLSQHTMPIHAVSLRPAQEGLPMVASAAGDRTIRFWQPTIGRMIRFARLDSEPLAITWTIDGDRVVAACMDGRVRMVDPVQVTVTDDLPAIEGWAYAVAVHPSDGDLVVGGTDGSVRRIELPK